MSNNKKDIRIKEIENIYLDDSPLTQDFFNLSNVFGLDYGLIPFSKKIVIFPIAGVLIIVGVVSAIINILNPLMVFMSAILVFFGLKLVHNTAMSYMHNKIRTDEFKVEIENYNQSNPQNSNIVFHNALSDELKNNIVSKLSLSNQVEIQNALEHKNSQLTILMADLVQEEAKSHKGLLYLSTSTKVAEGVHNTEKAINDWFEKNYELSLKKLVDLDDVELTVKNNSVILIFPFRFRTSEVMTRFIEFFNNWFEE